VKVFDKCEKYEETAPLNFLKALLQKASSFFIYFMFFFFIGTERQWSSPFPASPPAAQHLQTLSLHQFFTTTNFMVRIVSVSNLQDI